MIYLWGNASASLHGVQFKGNWAHRRAVIASHSYSFFEAQDVNFIGNGAAGEAAIVYIGEPGDRSKMYSGPSARNSTLSLDTGFVGRRLESAEGATVRDAGVPDETPTRLAGVSAGQGNKAH